MAQHNGIEEKGDKEEIFDRCFLCGKWWWQSAMRVVRVADLEGYVRKHVCVRCVSDVDGRSCLAH